MTKITGALLGLFLLVGGLGIAAAQEASEGTMPPPKVLTVFREFLKPGKAGATHDKSESAFVQAMRNAKWPTHYLAVDSLSGKPRSLYLTGYDSFEAWEKDAQASDKDAALSAAIQKAALADGELLSDTDASVLVFREDQSLRSAVDIAHMRYFEISVYQIRAGHRKEWDETVKLVTAAYEKIPDAHWDMYEEMYGMPGGEFVVFIPLKSASEIDQGFARDKEFAENMGEDGMKRLAELESAAVESRMTNLFIFNPKSSYPRDEWIKSDPDFWKPKSAMPMHMKKPAEKPSGEQ
jgi:hypothetical protein